MVEIGQEFTEYFEVNRNVHDGFIAVFADRHRLHTDFKYAVDRGFRAEVMHGNILNGFLSYFVGMCLPIPEAIILSQEIKFKRPVYLHDQLALEVLIHDVHHSVSVVELVCKFRNVADDNLVALAKLKIGETSVSKGK